MFARILSGRWSWLWVCLLALMPSSVRAESREYQIKAAFLVNFVQFVTWPSNSFTSGSAPFCIGVLGDDPFGPALEQAARGETSGSRPLVVRHWKRLEDCKDCQMLFVSRSEEKNLTAILGKLGPDPVLTVSETRGFARGGGVINFYLEGNKVRFEINPEAARRGGLKISAQLMSLGKIVEPAGEAK